MPNNPHNDRTRFILPSEAVPSEAVQQYADGATIKEIASEYGAGYGATRNALQRQGAVMRHRGFPAKPRPPRPPAKARVGLSERNREIKAKRKAGWTLKRIGEHYGLSHQRVQQIIRRTPPPAAE